MSKLYTVENSELNYKAYLCVDSVQGGLAFGGCRFATTVTADEITQLAACMTLKLAPHGLPVGGAKGGFAVDPKNPKMFEIIADFSQQMSFLLQNTVVLGKDLGANDEMMDYLYSSMNTPQLTPVQKKFPHLKTPDKIRQMTGYQKNMTGKGVAWSAMAFYKDNLKNKKVIIQGAGAVGIGSAVRLLESGAIVVGISDKDHCVYNPNGLSLEFFMKNVFNGVIHTLEIEPRYKVFPSAELYSLPSNILVLAAASNSVCDDHTQNVKAEIVIEGSNFGLIPTARALLHKKNIIVIPDVIASSSSAAMVAYQMSTGNSVPDDVLWKNIKQSITTAATQVIEIAKSEKMEVRDAYINILAPRLISQSKQNIAS